MKISRIEQKYNFHSQTNRKRKNKNPNNTAEEKLSRDMIILKIKINSCLSPTQDLLFNSRMSWNLQEMSCD